jgi:gas vesicle protein
MMPNTWRTRPACLPPAARPRFRLTGSPGLAVASGLSDSWSAFAKGISVESYERLKKLIAEIDEDVKKTVGGNKAAGTRVRQVMQDIKNAAQEVREKVLELRNVGDAPKQ